MLQSSSPVVLAADAFMPPLAPVVLLAFLGAGFLFVCCAVAAAVALAFRRGRLGRILGAAALSVAVVYATLLVGASLVSSERTLRPGERKYFCEMDCHLAYSVVGTGEAGGRRTVTVRTWFDPSTIASFRGDAPLTPNPRIVYLVDSAGRRHHPSGEAPPGSTPLTQTLRPGESYDTTFAFAAPASSDGRLRLFLGDPLGPENLIIQHENSPLHRKIYFELPAATLATGAPPPAARP